MVRRCILFCVVLTALLAFADAASSSMSCVYVNNERKCTSMNDPDGNMAAAAGVSSNGKGAVGAGAGRPDNFNTDFKQIGYDRTYENERRNTGFQPGQGNYGNGEIGAGYPFNQYIPQFGQGYYGNGQVRTIPGAGNPRVGQGNYVNSEVPVGGRPGNPFNPNFPQFGQQNYGNDEVADEAGAGYLFNPYFQQIADPYQYVRDFFRRRE